MFVCLIDREKEKKREESERERRERENKHLPHQSHVLCVGEESVCLEDV